MSNHITDLVAGAKESKNAHCSPYSRRVQGDIHYTVYSQLMLQALLKTKISASDQSEPSEQLEWVTLI